MANFLKLLLLRYLPLAAKRAFKTKRLLEDASYWSSFELPQQRTPEAKKLPDQPRLLIVPPADYDEAIPFEPASGNYNYEILRSSQERYGLNAVELFLPTKSNDWASECRMIAERVQESRITHLLFYIASKEPRSSLWRWDILAAELKRIESTVIAIGFLTDGTYELHQVQCSRFQEVYSQSVFIQIDVEPSAKYIRGGRLVGPTFLPISLESIARIREHILNSPTDPSYELSFIGKVYGYREKIIKKLQAKGVQVSINPQEARDRSVKPSYLEYMGALSRSRYTINFARANGTRQKQLKSRILESVLVGSIPVTDDNGLTRRILDNSGVPFVGFKRPHEIAGSVEKNFRAMTPSFEIPRKTVPPTEDVKRLASAHFWETLEKGLSDAALPRLVPASEVR
jgi:hypothetical protein